MAVANAPVADGDCCRKATMEVGGYGRWRPLTDCKYQEGSAQRGNHLFFHHDLLECCRDVVAMPMVGGDLGCWRMLRQGGLRIVGNLL